MKPTASMQQDKKLFNEPHDTTRAWFLKLSRLEDKTSNRLLYFSLFVSYAQIFFVNIQLARRYIPDEENIFSNEIRIIENLFNMDFQDDMVLLVSFWSTLIYFSLLGLTLFLVTLGAFRSKEPLLHSAKVWSFMIQTHAAVSFQPINNLCNNILVSSQDGNFQIFSQDKYNSVAFYFAIAIYSINFICAVLSYILIFDVLPSRNTLSSKDFHIDQIALFQKLIVPIIGKVLTPTSSVAWLVVALNLGLCIIPHFWCIYSLPRYHFKVLIVNLYLIDICVLASSVNMFVFAFNQVSDSPLTVTSLMILILLLAPLAIIYTRVLVKQIIKELLFKPFLKLNPHKAFQKVGVFKFIEKYMKKPDRRTKRIDNKYFLFAIIQGFPKNVFDEKDLSSTGSDFTIKDVQNQVKRKYLERLVTYYPQIEKYKLILAQFYAHNLKLYCLAINTLATIRSLSFKIEASVELLHLQIQDQLLKQTKHDDGAINLYEYVMTTNQKKYFIEEINEQVNCQISFWKEYMQNSPDVWKMQTLSEQIYIKKQQIEKRWNWLTNQKNKILHTLSLLYGNYHIVLNDSKFKGEEFLHMFNLFNGKYHQENSLTLSNLCDNDTFSVTIRTQQDYLGSISHCSQALERVLGFDQNFLVGSNVGILMSPFIAERHNGYIQEFIKTNQSLLLDKVRSIFVKNASGFLQKASIFVNIHPFLRQELLIMALIRLTPDPLEYIILTPEGEIDSCTEGIARRLGIVNKKVHIYSVCSEFIKIEKVYDYICKEGDKSTEYKEGHHKHYRDLGSNEDNIIKFGSTEGVLAYGTASSLLASPQKKIPIMRMLSMKNTHQAISHDIEVTQKEITLYKKYFSEKHQLQFNTFSTGPNGKRETFSYESRVSASLAKGNLMKIIEIEMIYDKNQYSVSQSFNTSLAHDNDDDTSRKDSGNPRFVTINVNNKGVSHSPQQPRKTFLFQTFLKRKARKLSKNVKNTLHTTVKLDPKAVINQPEKAMSSISSNSSAPKEKQKQTYLQAAFGARYYPKSVMSFLLVLATIALTILALQIHLEVTANNALAETKTLTTTFDLANVRADSLTYLARGVRGSYYIARGYILGTSSTAITTLQNFLKNIEIFIPILKDSNAQLQIAIQDTEDTFIKDSNFRYIRVYDITQDYSVGSSTKMDAFAAINILIDRLLRFSRRYTTTGGFSLEDIRFILINAVNDMLEGTVYAVDKILEETLDSVQVTLDMFSIYQILCIGFLCFGFVSGLVFVYWVYNYELSLMQSYLKLIPKDVENVRKQIENFGRVLKTEDFDQLNFIGSSNALVQSEYKIIRTNKNLKTQGLIRQYWKKLIVFFAIIIIYLAGINVVFSTITSQVEILKQKINGLAKSQALQYELSILSLAFGQVSCNDQIGTIRNRPVEEELDADLDGLLKYIDILIDAFKEKDGTISSEVTPIFFGDACQLVSAGRKAQCLDIVKDSKTSGLFSLLSRHYGLIRGLYQEIQVSNKTFEEFQTFSLDTITWITPSTLIIRDLLDLMINRARSSFYEIWDSSHQNVSINIILSMLVFVAMTFITVRYVIAYFMNFFNRFKRMMRIIPLEILLKNSTLKGILFTSSRGALDMIKHDL